MKSTTFAALLLATCAAQQARAQFTTIYNVPPDTLPLSGITSHTQINVFDGAYIGVVGLGNYFTPHDNMELNVHGGRISHLNIAGQSVVNIAGGVVDELYFDHRSDYAQADITLSGGAVRTGTFAILRAGSTITMTGGELIAGVNSFDDFDVLGALSVSGGGLNGDFRVLPGGVMNVSGGGSFFISSVFGGFHPNVVGVREGGQFNMSGGALNYNVYISGDAHITGGLLDQLGGVPNLYGGEFHLDGVPIAGLDTPGAVVQVTGPENSVLTGTLQDGTPFVYSAEGSTYTLHAADLPPFVPLIITSLTDPVLLGARAGQTLVVDDGSVGSFFLAAHGSTVDVQPGGSMPALKAYAADINVNGGTVELLEALSGSSVAISAGNVGVLWSSSDVDVEISGGMTEGLEIEGTASISGGIHSDLSTYPSAQVHLFGTNLLIDDVPIPGLDHSGATAAVNVPPGAELSGILRDGSPFAFATGFFGGSSIADGTLILHVVPEPSTLLLGAMAGFGLLFPRRTRHY